MISPHARTVNRLPLERLWNSDGDLSLIRGADVGEEEIRKLLRQSRIQFVVANCGDRLSWVPLEDCYRFWKEEVQARLVRSDQAVFRLEDFPGPYCYVGTLWTDSEGLGQVILLEKFH